MTYELAKQLKDVGFPQNTEFVDDKIGELIAFPTLSELIEACGEEFYKLERIKHESWVAYNMDDDHQGCWGKTPEEAVAKLWPALHSPHAGV